MTAFLIAVAVLLALALGVALLLWRSATGTVAAQARLIRHQCERIDGYRAELDALSIAGPQVDTRTGSHDRYPHMSDRARDAVLGALESAWHTTEHTQEKP